MSRKGCPNKIQSGISYPRKCSECNYVSNNPSMYSYHKKTHEPIPDGQICEHGCGTLALYRGTGGVYSCSQISQQCSGYTAQQSLRVKHHWIDAVDRKDATRESLKKRLHNTSTVAKMVTTKRAKTGILTPEDMKSYRHYARRIRSQAQRWAKEQGHTLGKQTFHVDHRLSILDAWRGGLSIDIVNHPANLQILEAKTNSSKGAKSQLTIDELIQLINRGV